MDLILLVVLLSIVALVVWLITTKIPMDPTIRLIIQVVAAILLLLYVLRQLNLPNVL